MSGAFVIRCDEFGDTPQRFSMFLKQVSKRRITRTRWLANARGFATIDEAELVAGSLRGRVGHRLVVQTRREPVTYKGFTINPHLDSMWKVYIGSRPGGAIRETLEDAKHLIDRIEIMTKASQSTQQQGR